jgi:hypothetical protein
MMLTSTYRKKIWNEMVIMKLLTYIDMLHTHKVWNWTIKTMLTMCTKGVELNEEGDIDDLHTWKKRLKMFRAKWWRWHQQNAN